MSHKFLSHFVVFLLTITSFIVLLGPVQNVSAGTAYTWNAPANGVASLNTNWNPVGVPTNTDSVNFGATSTFTCYFDLAISLTSFTIGTGAGTVTQNASFSCATFTMTSGIFTASISYAVTCSSAFTHTGGTITSTTLNLIMSGVDATLRTTAVIRDLTINQDTTLTGSNLDIRHSLTIASGKIFTLSNLWLYFYTHSAGATFNNLGTIAYPGEVHFNSGGGGTWTPTALGTINANVVIELFSGGTSTIFALPDDSVFGGWLKIFSNDATNTMTLSHGTNYDLTVNGAYTSGEWRGILISTRGIYSAGASTITCNANWDSSLGTFTQGTSSLILNPNSIRTIKTSASSTIYNLQISGSIETASDLAVSHDLIVNAGKVLTISSGYELEYNSSGGGAFSNSGAIAGLGSLIFSFDTADDSMVFGKVGVAEVEIVATSTATADRTLTMTEAGAIASSLTVHSEHATYLMIFDTTAGNFTIGNGGTFTNETRGMVYYSTAWSYLPESDYNYIIRNIEGVYQAYFGGTGTIESTDTEYADPVVQYAIDNSPFANEIHFNPGTYIFNCSNDFYVGGWNYSVTIDTAIDLTISGDNDVILKFRDGLTVAEGNGVSIFQINGTADGITISGLGFDWSTGLDATFQSAVFYYGTLWPSWDSVDNLTIDSCTFNGLNWSIWGDGLQNGVGVGNAITGNTFTNATYGMALHNSPSGCEVSGNTFESVTHALMIDSVSNITAQENTFLNCGEGEFGYCINIWDIARWVEVSENIFEDSTSTGRAILVDKVAGKEDCQNVTIERNAVTGFEYGVLALAGNDTTIENNSFLETIVPITDNATSTIVFGNLNYSYGGSFLGAAELRPNYVEYASGVRLYASISPLQSMANITLERLNAWSVNLTGLTVIVTFTISNLQADTTYKVYQDGVSFAITDSTTFTFTTATGGQFEVQEWYGKQVSTMIVMTVNLVGLGILIAVIGGFVMPFANNISKGKYRKIDVMMNDLLHCVVYIIVALLMWGLLQHIAIG